MGNCGAVTFVSSARSLSMTPDQLDPSAHAPCTSTTPGDELMIFLPFSRSLGTTAEYFSESLQFVASRITRVCDISFEAVALRRTGGNITVRPPVRHRPRGWECQLVAVAACSITPATASGSETSERWPALT